MQEHIHDAEDNIFHILVHIWNTYGNYIWIDYQFNWGYDSFIHSTVDLHFFTFI